MAKIIIIIIKIKKIKSSLKLNFSPYKTYVYVIYIYLYRDTHTLLVTRFVWSTHIYIYIHYYIVYYRGQPRIIERASHAAAAAVAKPRSFLTIRCYQYNIKILRETNLPWTKKYFSQYNIERYSDFFTRSWLRKYMIYDENNSIRIYKGAQYTLYTESSVYLYIIHYICVSPEISIAYLYLIHSYTYRVMLYYCCQRVRRRRWRRFNCTPTRLHTRAPIYNIITQYIMQSYVSRKRQ